MTESKTVTVPAELVVGILNYLRARPYAEVAAGVSQLEAVLAEQLPVEKPAE